MPEYSEDKKLSVEYAKKHTNTRCHMLGKCGDVCPLGIRYCDYRSRYEAFLQGCSAKYDKLKGQNRLKGSIPNQVQILVTRNDGVLMLANLSRRLMKSDIIFTDFVKKLARREVSPEEIEIIRQEAIDI